MRLRETSETVWETYPEEYTYLAELVTELGGAEGVVLVLALVYWVLDRETGARLAAYTVAGGGFVLALKFGLAMERPPAPVAADDPYGFPSGHAFNSVVVYGGLLYLFDRHRDWRYLLPTAGLVLAISLTRVVLQMHYLGDLITGAVLGVVFLLAMDRLVSGVATTGTVASVPVVGGALAADVSASGRGSAPAMKPRWNRLFGRADLPLAVAFAIGLVLGAAAVLVSGFDEHTIPVAGIALGGFLAAFVLDVVPPLQSQAEAAMLAAGGLVFLVAMILAMGLVGDSPGGVRANTALLLIHAGIAGGVLLGPLVSNRVGGFTQRSVSSGSGRE